MNKPHLIKKAAEYVESTKFNLLLRPGTTFFTSILCGLRYIIKNVGTAGVNNKEMYIDPEWFLALNSDEAVGLLMHELGHIIFMHIGRCEEFDLIHEIFNIAGDHYINLWLLSLGFKIPAGGYADPKYTGMSTMEIYDDLIKSNFQPPPTYVCDIMPLGDDESIEDAKNTIECTLLAAAAQAEMAGDPGSIPAEVTMLLDDIKHPKLPWQTILANYRQEYCKDDYSMGRPNRRFLPDFWIPSLHSLSLKQMTFGLDVSGSMWGECFSKCFKEICYMWETMLPDKCRLQTFDTIVHHNKLYQKGEALHKVKLKGGGGTNVVPLLESIAKEEPMLSIIFTDGMFNMPDMRNVVTDVIWVITENYEFKPPKGRVIYMSKYERKGL